MGTGGTRPDYPRGYHTRPVYPRVLKVGSHTRTHFSCGSKPIYLDPFTAGHNSILFVSLSVSTVSTLISVCYLLFSTNGALIFGCLRVAELLKRDLKDAIFLVRLVL